MMKKRIAKIGALTVGMTFVLGLVASPAAAQTMAELQAQITALMAQLAALQGSSAPSMTFTQNLTLGSTGSEVTALQQALVAGGHLSMPAGVAYGYFGALTKAAVAKWQAANGVSPAVGYWGPISRARYVAMAPSAPGTPSTPGTGITTPGVEGSITVSKNPSPAGGTKVYEAGSKVDVLGLKLEAKLSDVKVERVKIQLSAGTSGNSDQQFYTKIADRMYVMDGSTVLASVDLNSSTVVKESSSYYITITGFSFVVPKDSIKVLTIAVDPQPSWDSTYDNDSWTLTVPANGVRAVDGAGINQYGPSSTFNNSFTSAADVVDSAGLSVSLNANSPKVSQVIADQGSGDNEYDGLVLAMADFRATKDQVKVTDLIVNITRGGGNNVATATTAYIYDGSTLVGSATVAGTSATAMTATFSDIDWIIPADTTKTLTVKVDIDSAALAADTFLAGVGNVTAVATAVTSENSAGSSITETGSATGRTITIRNVGPEISLVSKSIVTAGAPQTSSSPNSTSTLTATFNVKIKAVGGPIILGTVASTSDATQGPAFSKELTTNSFKLYSGGVASSVTAAGTSTSYAIPSGCVVTGSAESCTLSEGSEVTIPVTYQIIGRLAAGTAHTTGLYSLGLEKVNWAPSTGAIQSTTFMAGESDWRTADVSFP